MKDIHPYHAPRLEIRDLEVVLAVAAARTTAKAAATLRITQPAVSRALLAVEHKLGTELFQRTPRGLVPTEGGKKLLAGANEIMGSLTELEHRVISPDSIAREIRIVCECYTAYHWLPTALVSLRRSLPGLSVSVSIEHTRDPIEGLESGKVDVALLTTAIVPRGVIEACSLFSDELVFVISAKHPLAKKRYITRENLIDGPLITSNTPAAEEHRFLTNVFGRARPRLRFERLPLTEAILDVARAGMGIAVLSEWIAGPHLDKGDLVAKRLQSGPLLRPWRIAWRRDARDAANRLHVLLESAAPKAGI